MLESSLHPNTSAMLQAWRRLIISPQDTAGGPAAGDYPELLARLFTVDVNETGEAIFRAAGEDLTSILGRDLIGTNFLQLWVGPDRALVSGLLDSIINEGGPGLLRGFGETNQGRRVEIEIAMAPLEGRGAARNRIICLYQTLGGEAMLNDRSIWIHRLRSIFPPEPPLKGSTLRLVADNTLA